MENVEPLRVALPLGIGDCHWVCQKLRGLSEFHGGRPVHAHVNASPFHQTANYLGMVSCVAKAVQDHRAPYDLARDMAPGHREPHWSTLEGCRGWRWFDYILVPNGHLERGERIETWLPEIATDYRYALNVPTADWEWARSHRSMLSSTVLLYLSGVGPNRGFHNHWWTIKDWMEVVRLLNEAGIEPVIIGGKNREDDDYVGWFGKVAAGKVRYRNLVGQTTHGQVMALILESGAWCGLNSGLGIVAAAMGVPTVMLWSDHRFPLPGVGTTLHGNMQRSWLEEGSGEFYRTLSYGSPELTPRRVFEEIMAVKR